MRAAVTGGAGFIGHHLVAGLLARGDEVRVVDDFSTGTRERLDVFGDAVTTIEGSILDPQALDAAFAGSEVVFHEAAMASVAESLEAPRRVMEINAGGSVEVMLAAHRAGIRRVVFAGSSAVYGIPEKLPCLESQRAEPISPYGASKLAAEHLIHALGRQHGVETVVLRYFNVYGPGQDPAAEYAAVVPRFIAAVLEARAPVVFGTGDISRDFIDVRDVVTANLLAAGRSGPPRLTCNIASGSPTSLLALLDAIGRAVGRVVEPVYGPARVGDIPHSVANVTLAREALGFIAQVTLDEGMRNAVAAFRSGTDGRDRSSSMRTSSAADRV